MRTLRAASVATCGALLVLAGAIGACGAKTGLRAPPIDASRDVPIDAFAPADASADAGMRTYLGTEFFAVTTANSSLHEGNTFHFAVAIGNPNPDPVTVVVTGGSLASTAEFEVPPRSAVARVLPWVHDLVQNSLVPSGCPASCCDLMCCDSSTSTPSVSSRVSNGAYHIRTSAPVSAYQFNAWEYSVDRGCVVNSYTNDASLLLPVPSLTQNYLVLAHNAFANAGSFLAVAAVADGTTTVTVHLTSDVTEGRLRGAEVAGAGAGSRQTYTLQQGDVVQLVSTAGADMGQFMPQDLTGTTVQSDRPVAVWAGVDCTNMSWPDGTLRACDHIEQQMFPLETWGRRVVVSQLQDRGTFERYMVRVMSGADGNTITFTPAGAHAAITLRRGQFIEFESDRDVLLEATGPMLVAQYMEGQETTPGATVGDPAMVLEPPVDQYRRDYSFVVPSTYTSSFINVVGSAGASIALDGHALTSPLPLAGTPFAVWRHAIAPGSHYIASADGSRFGLKVLGVAPYTSYAYPGGLDLGELR